MSRHLFLFVSVAFLIAATWFPGGARSGRLAQIARAETYADISSLQDDLRILRDQTAQLKSELRALWLDARSDVAMLRSDAGFEARRLTRSFIAIRED